MRSKRYIKLCRKAERNGFEIMKRYDGYRCWRKKDEDWTDSYILKNLNALEKRLLNEIKWKLKEKQSPYSGIRTTGSSLFGKQLTRVLTGKIKEAK